METPHFAVFATARTALAPNDESSPSSAMVGNRELADNHLSLARVLHGATLVGLSPGGYSPGGIFSGASMSSREFKETTARLDTSALDKSLTSGFALTIALVAIGAIAWSLYEFWNQIVDSIGSLRLPHLT